MTQTQHPLSDNQVIEQHTDSESKRASSISQRCFRTIETTYSNNIDSDYTEKIAALSRNFRYADNQEHFWTLPAQSLLYGTPLYAEASRTQKLVLNHLGWAASYIKTANTECTALDYNPVTADVLELMGGYDTLAKEIQMETEQEVVHIRAFRKIGLTTMVSLIDRSSLDELAKWRPQRTLATTFQLNMAKKLAIKLTDRNQASHYAEKIKKKQRNSRVFKSPMGGLLDNAMGSFTPLHSLYGFGCGSGSLFMACQFYTLRMMANLKLKDIEHPIAKYAKQLENNHKFVPAPTAISRYHFLDEAFHTTISKLLGKDLYQEFEGPNLYENLIANFVIYMMQRSSFGSVSAVIPDSSSRDGLDNFALVYYLLRSPIFEFSHLNAKQWMRRCFCEEHNGFHQSVKNRTRLLKSLKIFSSEVSYLWPINRDMTVMGKLGSINTALKQNIRTFDRFFKELEQFKQSQ